MVRCRWTWNSADCSQCLLKDPCAASVHLGCISEDRMFLPWMKPVHELFHSPFPWTCDWLDGCFHAMCIMILLLVRFIYILEGVNVFLGCKNKLNFTKFCGRVKTLVAFQRVDGLEPLSFNLPQKGCLGNSQSIKYRVLPTSNNGWIVSGCLWDICF